MTAGETLFQAAGVTQVCLAFGWMGLVTMSCIAAPLKFKVMERSVAVRLGKVMFRTLNHIELVLAPLVLIALLFGSRDVAKILIFLAISVILLSQTFWLIPTLFPWADEVIGGMETKLSFHHRTYIILEGIKLIALFAFGTVAALGRCA
jgi:hypothetical protein